MRLHLRAALASAVALVLAGFPTAQIRVEVRAPLVVRPLDASPDRQVDPGRPVRMLESPNIDRFLRRAADLLGHEEYESAILVLQDVIDGRTLEAPAPPEEPGREAPKDPAPAGAEDPGAEPAAVPLSETAEHAVFSADGRLYRPVERLCHEMLAALPPEGRALYRARYEVEAERALAEATAARSAALLEQVYEHWFVTFAAAHALQRAADLQMDQGRFRAAIQNFGLLLDVYPAEDRAAAGIADPWVRFKSAVCFRMLGDDARAAAELERLTSEHPDATLRVMGELVAVADLATTPYFRDLRSAPARPAAGAARAAGFATPGATVVPLWEYRFEDPEAYRSARGGGQPQRVVFAHGDAMLTAAPQHNAFRPGTSVAFTAGRIAFLDHFRLTVVDALSGALHHVADGPTRAADPRPGTPRSRVAAYDWGGQRVASTGQRFYVLVGPGPERLTGMQAVLENHVEAWRLGATAAEWTTRDVAELRGVTFLAAPVVFAGRVLVPTAAQGAFGMHCLDAATGAVLYHVPVHAEGTDFARPPASRVAVHGGLAYVLTNAGAIACIDAHTGALRWTRRYERTDPFRPSDPRLERPTNRNMFAGQIFQEQPLPGFGPSDILTHDGLVVFAPCDGRAMVCLDGATGEPVWINEQGDMDYLIGHDGDHVYAGGPDGVFCIGLHNGLRYWREELPTFHGSRSWRGRATLADGHLYVPGERAVHVRPAGATPAPWETYPLPDPSFGSAALDGPTNLFVDGALLAVVHEGGIELYTTVEALRARAEAATDPVEKAVLLAQAGELLDAVGVLEAVGPVDDPERRAAIARRMLSWCGELSLALAAQGERQAALDLLERCHATLREHRMLQRWHLARIEVFQALGDAAAVVDEQEALYRLMGGS